MVARPSTPSSRTRRIRANPPERSRRGSAEVARRLRAERQRRRLATRRHHYQRRIGTCRLSTQALRQICGLGFDGDISDAYRARVHPGGKPRHSWEVLRGRKVSPPLSPCGAVRRFVRPERFRKDSPRTPAPQKLTVQVRDRVKEALSPAFQRAMAARSSVYRPGYRSRVCMPPRGQVLDGSIPASEFSRLRRQLSGSRRASAPGPVAFAVDQPHRVDAQAGKASGLTEVCEPIWTPGTRKGGLDGHLLKCKRRSVPY